MAVGLIPAVLGGGQRLFLRKGDRRQAASFSPLGAFKGGEVYPDRRNGPAFGPGFRVPALGTFYVPPISRPGDSFDVVPTVANDRPFAAIPVQAVRFSPDLSLTDTAPAGRPLIVPVDVQNEPTASPSAVPSLTVQVSYDDGTTWHNVVVAGTGDHRVAVIPTPSAGFVSLRAAVTNATSNSMSETIIRAYGIG